MNFSSYRSNDESGHRAVQIIKHESDSSFKADENLIQKIFGNERVASLPLVVLCIAGAARKGKSFILNFFLDYLNYKEKNPRGEWTLNENTRLVGFQFCEGDERTTLGIWCWNHVFVIEQNNGQKVAVTLVKIIYFFLEHDYSFRVVFPQCLRRQQR